MTTNNVEPTPLLIRMSYLADSAFGISVLPDEGNCIVRIKGELDCAGRAQVVDACTAAKQPSVTVDLSQLTFMDCGGYRSIVESSNIIHADGRTLTVFGPSGQPKRLIERIRALPGRHDCSGSAV